LDQDYPYVAATQLILRLPAGHEAEKRAIFVNAMAHDREHSSLGILTLDSSPSYFGEGDDLSGMVVRFWRHFPPELVLDAIDQILDHSKTDDTQIAMKASSGPINFDNVYQYRLFELLPVLRELDPSKAEQLSNDPRVQAQLNKYPNGLQSLDPTVRDTPLRKGEEPGMRGFGVGRGAKALQDSQSAEIYQRQANEILKQAGDDPRQAIATAATLPVQAGHTVPRSETLLRIAQVEWKKNASASKEALEQMADSLKKVDPATYRPVELRIQVGMRVQYCWSDGVELANNMKDIDLARSLLHDGLEQAERWKGVDDDDKDPNYALKAWWPSVALFSALLRSAAHISPQTALELIHKLQDPDLVTLFQIRVANDRLGADEESLH
jgi:plastocyanin